MFGAGVWSLTMRESIECDTTMFPVQSRDQSVRTLSVWSTTRVPFLDLELELADENLITDKQSARIETSSVLQSGPGHRHNARLKIF